MPTSSFLTRTGPVLARKRPLEAWELYMASQCSVASLMQNKCVFSPASEATALPFLYHCCNGGGVSHILGSWLYVGVIPAQDVGFLLCLLCFCWNHSRSLFASLLSFTVV